MSWGVKIAVLYCGFALLIITLVSLSMRQNVDLVAADYYEQELHFQDKIDKIERTRLLSEPLTWELKNDALLLNFPNIFNGQKISGSLYFFRPSDASLDKIVTISPDTVLQRIVPVAELEKGIYKLQVSWKVAEVDYFNESVLNIN